MAVIHCSELRDWKSWSSG